MIKNDILKIFAILIAGCAMLVSCQPEGPEDSGNEELVFPEYKEYTVAPGDTVVISFEAPADWTVSVPDDMLQWFWIQDGSFEVYRLSGKAGSRSVSIVVSETEEFDTDRTCAVTLTMGDEAREIAKLTRYAKNRSLALSAAQVVDGEIKFTEDGSSYLYMDGEPSRMELVWGGTDFRLPVRIEANFDWTYSGPEWLKINVPENGTGVNELILFGVPSKYPLSDAAGALKFMYGEEVIKEYEVAIPGCSSIFSYRMDMGLTELQFNFKGQFKTPAGFIGGPEADVEEGGVRYPSGSFFGTSGVRVVVLSKTAEGYSTEAPSWLSVNQGVYDDTDGADVLQERFFTVVAEINEGENREAAIFILPPYVDAAAGELFTASDVKEEYVEYMIPVIQLSMDQEFISMIANPSDVAAAGVTFTVSEDETLFTKFGEAKYAYELTYTNQYASNQAHMMFTSAVTSVKIFDETGGDMTEDEEFFLSVRMNEDMLGGVIDMTAEVNSVGYVVMYGTTGNILAVVKCTLDPEQVVEEVEDVAFIGESVTSAPLVGATLENVTDDPSFSSYRDGNVPVYHLRYTTENNPMTISIPASVRTHDVNPYQFIDNIKVNDISYMDENNPAGIGGVTITDGGVTIYMHMYEGRQYMRGNINFRRKATSSDDSGLVLVLVCTMDLRETAE